MEPKVAGELYAAPVFVASYPAKSDCKKSPGNKAGNAHITVHCRTFEQPLLQWESNEYYISSVCVCSLRCPACNALTPYCHMWPARLYNIFPQYLINGTIFEKSY